MFKKSFYILHIFISNTYYFTFFIHIFVLGTYYYVPIHICIRLWLLIDDFFQEYLFNAYGMNLSIAK